MAVCSVMVDSGMLMLFGWWRWTRRGFRRFLGRHFGAVHARRAKA
jgi:uncharacterized membrane protein